MIPSRKMQGHECHKIHSEKLETGTEVIPDGEANWELIILPLP